MRFKNHVAIFYRNLSIIGRRGVCMTKGYVLKVDSQEWEAREFNGYDDISAAIGGYLECVDNNYASVYVHEEGKILGLTPTTLWVDSETGAIMDVICGPIVLLGFPDEEGDDTDLSEEDFRFSTDSLVVIALDKRSFIKVPEPSVIITNWEIP